MTIREIARMTGLSTTTVCKALRSPSSVRESTWRQIEQVRGSTGVTGLSSVHIVLPDLKNTFFSELLEGCIEVLSKKGLAPRVYLSQDNAALEKEIFQSIPNRSHEGIIWVPSSRGNTFLPEHRRVVLADRDAGRGNSLSKVLLDNDNLAFHGVEYLASLHPVSVFFINGPQESSTSQAREKGARLAAEQFGLNIDVYYADFVREKAAYGIALELLAVNPNAAYLLGNQSIAFGFLKALKTLRVNPPPCITFDRLPEILSPQLAYIDLPAFRIGQKAAQILVQGNPRNTGQQVFTIQGSLHFH